MKLYKIDKLDDIVRITWIHEEEGFKQSHIAFSGVALESNIGVASNILESFGFEKVENFDKVSDVIMKRAGIGIG